MKALRFRLFVGALVAAALALALLGVLLGLARRIGLAGRPVLVS